MTNKVNNLAERYGFFYINGRRAYKIDLTTKHYAIDSYRPLTFLINGKPIDEGTWTRLIERLTNYLINKHSPDCVELLNHRVEWSKTPIFLKNSTLPAHIKLSNGIYVNCNRTATHLLWTIQEILVYFNFDLSDCELFVVIPQNKENTEVINHFYEENKTLIKKYLIEEEHYSEEKAKSFIAFLNKMDKLLIDFNSSFISFILFETTIDFSNIKSRFIKNVYPNIRNEKAIKGMDAIFEVLLRFYRFKFDKHNTDMLINLFLSEGD